MYTPTLRPPVTRATKQQGDGLRSFLRWGLLVWAVLRLTVSVLVTGLFLFRTVYDIQLYTSDSPNRLGFDIYAISIQLVEFCMIVTFITAGIKKSVSLYRAYFCYCILTLIIYVIAVILDSLPFYDGEFYYVYFTFHLTGALITDSFEVPYIAFLVIASIDVVLEVLLIFSVKELMKRYSSTSSENVKSLGV